MTNTETAYKLKEGCGFYLDVFGQPEKVKLNQLIPIATRVKFSHQAAVVRWKSDYKMWKLAEPRVDWYPPIAETQNEDRPFFDLTDVDSPKDFWSTPNEKINKDIIVWREIGVAYIFGFVKRGIGKSVKGYSLGGGYYDPPEYEPGYFDALTYVPLYALKSHIEGVDYFFAPTQCVEVI